MTEVNTKLNDDDGVRPLLLKPAQAIKVLGCSRSRLYQLIRDREIEGVFIGPTQRRFPYDELQAYVDKLKAERDHQASASSTGAVTDEPPASNVA